MNALDVLRYGHQTVQQTVDGLPQDVWVTPGACGAWSPKEVIAHLASFEHVLEDVLTTFTGGGPTPYLDRFAQDTFNDAQVAQRQHLAPAEALAEYVETHARVMDRTRRIPPETWRLVGALPWYGAEYALDDFIVYTFYGHKREHCAQIAALRDRLAR